MKGMAPFTGNGNPPCKPCGGHYVAHGARPAVNDKRCLESACAINLLLRAVVLAAVAAFNVYWSRKSQEDETPRVGEAEDTSKLEPPCKHENKWVRSGDRYPVNPRWATLLNQNYGALTRATVQRNSGRID
jgi:hypothetical protein